jgi:hypothetical protein
MLLVTLHGGKPQKDPHKNNVHAYDKDGTKLATGVLEDAPGVVLDELREIALYRGALYVVNANKTQNGVLRYTGADTAYRFGSTFASAQTCAGILHPFGIAFDGAGYCYVSSQDTNVVTRLKIAADGTSALPAPIAPALPAGGKFLPGTFVASSVGTLSNPPTTPVAGPAGLGYTGGDTKHSVRGVLWAKNMLYVADEPAGRVKIYDANGKYLGQSNQVESPVHLATHQGKLYVSGGNHVLLAKLANAAGDFVLEPIPDLKVEKASGLAFTDSGHVYIARRKANEILKFDANDGYKPLKFECAPPDNPEFLLHV